MNSLLAKPVRAMLASKPRRSLPTDPRPERNGMTSIILYGSKREAQSLRLALKYSGVGAILTDSVPPSIARHYFDRWPKPAGIVIFPGVLSADLPETLTPLQGCPGNIILLTHLQGQYSPEEVHNLGVAYWFVNLRITERIAREPTLITSAVAKATVSNGDLQPIFLSDIPPKHKKVSFEQPDHPKKGFDAINIAGRDCLPNSPGQAKVLRFLQNKKNWCLLFSAKMVAIETRMVTHQASTHLHQLMGTLPPGWLETATYGFYIFNPEGIHAVSLADFSSASNI